MTQTVYEIITGLQAAKGTKAKSAILLENAGNIELNSYLRAVFEPTVNYYIAKMQFEETPEGDVANLGSWLNLMDKLASREVTGNEARNYLQGVYNALNNEQRVLLKLLINRNIKAGVAAGSINKVMPGLIREVPYQRACLPKDSNLSKLDWSKGIIVQLKADGSFANMYTGSQPIVETRNGNIYQYGLDKLREALKLIPAGETLHGELLVRDLRTGEILPRHKGNGILNAISQDGEVDENYEVVADVWDVVPTSVMVPKGRCLTPYRDRLDRVREIVGVINKQVAGVIQVIETHVVYSRKEAKVIYVQVRDRGLEGTVIKNPEAIWLDGDNPDQIKEKVEVEVDLVIRGFNQGDPDGKYANTLGSLICESEDGLVRVGVSGMTDADRHDFWNNREFYEGMVITVVINGFMYNSDKGETDSLFLPRIVEKRFDKTAGDTRERIIQIIDNA